MPAEIPLTVAGIVLLAATVQSATGFGYALVAAPLLAVVVGPALALPVLWLTFLPAAVMTTVHLRAQVSWAIGWRMSLAGAFTTLMGASALHHVPPRPLQAATGLSVLAFTLVPRPAGPMSARTTDIIAGALAGFLGAATGTAGPPLVLALSRRGLSQAQLRATLAWVFALLSVTTLVSLTLTRHVTRESCALLLTSALPLAAGPALGSFLVRRLSDRATATTIRLLLLGSGLVCLTKAVVP
jgi:uncharacterized protein